MNSYLRNLFDLCNRIDSHHNQLKENILQVKNQHDQLHKELAKAIKVEELVMTKCLQSHFSDVIALLHYHKLKLISITDAELGSSLEYVISNEEGTARSTISIKEGDLVSTTIYREVDNSDNSISEFISKVNEWVDNLNTLLNMYRKDEE